LNPNKKTGKKLSQTEKTGPKPSQTEKPVFVLKLVFYPKNKPKRTEPKQKNQAKTEPN
jgi:hypothetical protein